MYLHRISNEDASLEISYRIDGLGTSDSLARIKFYDEKLLLITSENEFIYLTKDLQVLQKFSITSTATNLRTRFEHIDGDYLYGTATYTNSTLTMAVYYKTLLPYMNDIEESILNFASSTLPYTFSSITPSPSFSTSISVSSHSKI